jgi:hypothetical protein
MTNRPEEGTPWTTFGNSAQIQDEEPTLAWLNRILNFKPESMTMTMDPDDLSPLIVQSHLPNPLGGCKTLVVLNASTDGCLGPPAGRSHLARPLGGKALQGLNAATDGCQKKGRRRSGKAGRP